MLGEKGLLDKKSILFSIFFLGWLIKLLLRIPEWGLVCLNGTSNIVKIWKNQNLISVTSSKIRFKASKSKLNA